MNQQTDHTPLTDEQLDEIDARAAHLFEYVTMPTEADQLAGVDVPALLAEVHRLRAEATELRGENAKLIRWHREDEAAFARMRTTITRLRDEKRELGELAARRESELIALRARVAELERPAIEAKRNEIRDSYAELIATAEETKDFEGAFDVQCRLREREEQWKREDAAPAASAVSSATDAAGPGSTR